MNCGCPLNIVGPAAAEHGFNIYLARMCVCVCFALSRLPHRTPSYNVGKRLAFLWINNAVDWAFTRCWRTTKVNIINLRRLAVDCIRNAGKPEL